MRVANLYMSYTNTDRYCQYIAKFFMIMVSDNGHYMQAFGGMKKVELHVFTLNIF
jgi:hypothetical protein